MTEQETQETNEQNEAETTQETKAKSPKLNTPTKATKLILKHLNKAQKQNLIDELTDETKRQVAQTVVSLYTDYETNDVAPSLDGFAAKAPSYGITDQALIDAVLAMKKDPFIKSSKAPVAVAVVLIAALATAGAYAYANNQTTETEAEAEVEEVIEEAVAGVLDFDITAENWTEDSSPFIALIEGITAEDAEYVSFYHAVWADGSTDTVELDPGTYLISWISAINADGSIYVTTDVVTEVTVESDGTVTGKEAFDQIAAEDVTSEQLEEILAEIAEAVANGDETLTSNAGTTVVEVASGNAANNPNADVEAVEEAAEAASESVSETATSTGSSSGSSSSSSSSSSSGSSGSSSSSSSGSSSSGSSSSSSGSSSGSSSSSHTHTWQANTTQQWVVDQAGYYETTKTSYVECYCGQTFDKDTDWSAHRIELIVAGVDDDEYSRHTGYYNRYKTVETWVDEVGHYETVTTGYTCTSCGATKSA